MIPDDELQAMRERCEECRKRNEEQAVAWEQDSERLRDEIDRLKVENEKLTAELATWKPMTPEEAEAALDAAVGIPISDEEIDRIVAKVTDPAYRPPESEHVLMAAKIEQLRAELAAKEIRWTDAKPTTEGWWHYRSGGNHDDDYCILFCKEMNEEIVVHFLGGIWCAADMRGQWSDKPISQPEERTCELPQETK